MYICYHSATTFVFLVKHWIETIDLENIDEGTYLELDPISFKRTT